MPCCSSWAAAPRRPVNPPITQADPNPGYTFQTRQKHFKSQDNLVVLAFSGGGTRAAAFSYGVLEFLRRTEVVAPNGDKVRLLDAVDMITGVSGGSFTALAYGLYGDKLFADYEQRFLKRDVQGELVARALNPGYWGDLSSTGWGRSELAASYYDEILFNGATFGDLDRGDGPFIVASATDISTGGRVPFNQNVFNVLCSDLNAVRLSRAAAASSAVPVVLSTVTINNYGGTCNYDASALGQDVHPIRESAAARGARDTRAEGSRALRRQREPARTSTWWTAACPTTWACAACSTRCELLEALHDAGLPTPLDHVQAGSSSSSSIRCRRRPPTGTNRSRPPGTVDVLLKSTGVPIDHYSYEAVELLKDICGAVGDGAAGPATWPGARPTRTRRSAPRSRVPQAEIYAIDVSFAALTDKAERDYLNQQPTSFVLPAEAVDRLRAAAGTIILASPEFQRLLKDVGAKVVADPRAGERQPPQLMEFCQAIGRAASPAGPRRCRGSMRRTPAAVLAATLLLSPGIRRRARGGERRAPLQPRLPRRPRAAPPATVTDTVTQATASEELQRAALARLEQAGRWRDLAQRVAALEAELDALAASAMAKAELVDPIDLDRQLRALHRAATTIVDDLATIVRRLEHDGNALEADARKWQERLRSWRRGSFPRRSSSARDRSRRSCRARAPACGNSATACCSRSTARWRCRRASTTRARSSPRSRSASARKGCSWKDPRCGSSARRPRSSSRRRRAARGLAVAARLPRAGWRRTCRVVLRRPGADRLALHHGSPGRTPAGAARLRPTGRRIAAHRADVAVVAGARPAAPVLRGAARARPDSRRDGGAARARRRPFR